MPLRKNPEVNLKFRYSFFVRVSAFIVLVALIAVFKAFPRFQREHKKIEQADVVIEQVDIPATQQHFEQPSRPSRPSIPVESESEDIGDDVTIEELTFEEFEWDAPPPPPPDENEGPKVRFIPYDEAPEPIGGFAAIQRNVVYPEIAKEAGIEGDVVVQAFVNEKGIVTDCVILQGIPKTGLNEAAIAAIKKTRFKPAKQRDRVVGVWISIPIHFQLKSN